MYYKILYPARSKDKLHITFKESLHISKVKGGISMTHQPTKDNNKKPVDNNAKIEHKNLQEKENRQTTNKHSYSKKTDHL